MQSDPSWMARTLGVLSPRQRWAFIFALWLAPALMSALVEYAYSTAYGPPRTLAFCFEEETPGWIIWIAMTPVIIWLVDREPLAGGRRLRTFALHLAACLIAILLFSAVHAAFSVVLHPATPPRPYLVQLGRIFVGWGPMQATYYAFLCAAALAIHAVSRQSALRVELAQAQLHTLQSQLQPHFLFNTLNAAVTLARRGETRDTVRVLMLLSELLRALLRGESAQEVPLQRELALLRSYLEIQQIRYSDRMRVHWALEPELDDAAIPMLSLQPLVENAIQHGIAKHSESGQLHIAIRRNDGSLVVEIRDDGPGLEPGFTLEQAKGIGLRTTRLRLEQLYGPAAGLTLRNAEGGGTIAELHVPLRRIPMTQIQGERAQSQPELGHGN